MNDTNIIDSINSYLHTCAMFLEKWLSSMLPRVSDSWWQDCVLDKLSYNQRMIVDENNITKLAEFDLAALLRLADRNWYAMCDFAFLPTKERECIRDMIVVRNKWANCAGELPDKESIKQDIVTIIKFLEYRGGSSDFIQTVYEFSKSIDTFDSGELCVSREETSVKIATIPNEITEKSIVYMVAQPDVKGVGYLLKLLAQLRNMMCLLKGQLKPSIQNRLNRLTMLFHIIG